MAQCDSEERCVATHGRRYSSRQACVDAAAGQLAQLSELLLGFYEFADTAQIPVCLADLAQLPCGEIDGAPPSCQLALRRLNAVGEGEVCYQQGNSSNGTGCDWDLECRVENNCGFCVTRVGAGEACTGTGDCRDNLYCDTTGGNGTCVARRVLGELCTNYDQCGGNLDCRIDAANQRRCLAPQGVGSACASDSECYRDLRCSGSSSTRLCAPALADGAACDRTNSDPDCLSYCVFANPNDADGRCSYSPSSGLAGTACSYIGSYAFCNQDTWADEVVLGGVATSCVCRDKLPANATCTSNSQCTTACVGPSGSRSCAPITANGQPCSSNSMCSSGYCDNAQPTSVCADPPVCN